MVIYIDIDETICHSPDVPDYTKSYPILENIQKANELYEQGHTIVYWTARGTKTGIDWREHTENQFKEWGVKYHELKFGKPNYDVFIDDKNMNTENWTNLSVLNNKTLDQLANKYQTDKGSLYQGRSRHGYAKFYDKIFSTVRYNDLRMLEIGICMEGTEGGHSVYMWKDYFPSASLYTFDIVDMTSSPAIKDQDRVFFYKGDQGNRNDLTDMYEKFGNEKFDFIIEDGSHTTEHQMVSFGHLFQYVKPGGVYILEDVSIPGNAVCCIRNDETFGIIDNFNKTGKFETNYLTPAESLYIETNVERFVGYTDVQNAYMTFAFYKKGSLNYEQK